MKTLFTIFTIATTASLSLHAQETTTSLNDTVRKSSSVKAITKKTEVKREFEVTNSMFISNEIPADLPNHKDYKSNDLYKKVIQGYINTHSELFNPIEVQKMGLTYPNILTPQTPEQKANTDQFKRTTPISEEEKNLKKQKESEIKQ